MIIARHVVRLESQRRPKLGPGSIKWSVRWKHADHCAGFPIQRERSPENFRIGSEARLPKAVTQNHNLRFPGLILIRGEGAAQRRADPEDIKVRRRDAGRRQFYRFARAS